MAEAVRTEAWWSAAQFRIGTTVRAGVVIQGH